MEIWEDIAANAEDGAKRLVAEYGDRLFSAAVRICGNDCDAGDDVYPTGAQIDLLLERADNVINICEMKYSSGPFAIDKAMDSDLAAKVETFRAVSKTQKAIHLTFVTSRGLVRNSYWNDVQSEVTLDDLFKE